MMAAFIGFAQAKCDALRRKINLPKLVSVASMLVLIHMMSLVRAQQGGTIHISVMSVVSLF